MSDESVSVGETIRSKPSFGDTRDWETDKTQLT